jgi:hypothetical protein
MADAELLVIVRLAGGGLVIAYEQDRENIPLIEATYVLLNIGLIPLLAAFNRFLNLVQVTISADLYAPPLGMG